MNRESRFLDPPPGLTGSAAAGTKPNRLRRSYRRTQPTQTPVEVEPPKAQQFEFKTPTRIPTPRAGVDFSGESPHNDSDCQQDIIWDATSPSPSRLGKRGKKQLPGVVNISEIVSRIAPKHGRPKAAEPTLQQWIGDSATIPCTPDVQTPKPKKKSPRPNGVDDLLKLAKQFDFNMFRQDEEEVEDLHQQSLELLSGDILDLENGDQNDFSTSFPENQQPAVNTAAGNDVQVHLDLQMEDDFDLLFDGPTQRVSGSISQVSQAKPASGRLSVQTPGVPKTNVNSSSADVDFEDDWENDDLLNDSIVLEMTQNPQIFSPPKHSSTQRPACEVKHVSKTFPASRCGSIALGKVGNVRQRSTFKLETNPNSSLKRTQTDTWTNSKVELSSKTGGKDSQQSKLSSVRAVSGSHLSWQTSNTAKPDPQKDKFKQKASVSGVPHSLAAPSASLTSAANTAQSFPQRPAAVSNQSSPPAVVSDLPDEDLNSFFESDPVWDDLVDDDLLCEMCEDVENKIQSAERQILPSSTQRAALQPVSRAWENWTVQKPLPQKPQPQTSFPRAAGSSYSGSFVPNVAAGAQMKTDSLRYLEHQNASGSMKGSDHLQASSRIQSTPQGSTHRDQFTFKRPNNPISTVTNTVVGKCSAAEIELKKQQAMERRRQRLQASSNLRAPT